MEIKKTIRNNVLFQVLKNVYYSEKLVSVDQSHMEAALKLDLITEDHSKTFIKYDLTVSGLIAFNSLESTVEALEKEEYLNRGN